MRKWKWLAAMALAATLLAMLAIGRRAEATAASDVKKKAGETVEAAGDYAHESKDQFAAKVQARIESVQKNIDDLKLRAQATSGEAHDRVEAQIAKLEQKRDELTDNLARLRASSGSAWRKLRAGLDRAWSQTQKAFGDARAELSSDPAQGEQKKSVRE